LVPGTIKLLHQRKKEKNDGIRKVAGKSLTMATNCQMLACSFICAQGKIEAWVDPNTLRSFQGVAAVPDAIDAMLEGGHVGKVVTKIIAS
jgi:NADPH-dependent curcumin reductase CurA